MCIIVIISVFTIIRKTDNHVCQKYTYFKIIFTSSDMFSNSNYFNSLSSNDQEGYVAKLTLSNGEILPDPFNLDQGWDDDVKLLPDISWPDIYNYLINSPSSFSKENLKAYKSLEAYNFFICGHVQDVFYHDISQTSYFCFLKSQVTRKT